MTSAEVAATIHEQLGGHQFDVMTGAHGFTRNGFCLMFKLHAHSSNGFGAVRIELTPLDLYTVEFFHRAGHDKRFEMVSFDQLIPIFEATTGLRTKL